MAAASSRGQPSQLLEWVSTSPTGARLPQAALLQEGYEHGDDEIELLTCRAVSKLEPVLSLPYSRLFTAPAASTLLHQAGVGCSGWEEQDILGAGLAVARAQGPPGTWWAYASTLPKGLPGLGWHLPPPPDDENQSETKIPLMLLSAAHIMKQRVAQLFEAHKPAFVRAMVGATDLGWGFAMHHSRAMRIPQSEGVAGGSGFVGAMVPLGDMANHSAGSMASWRVGMHLPPSAPKRRRLLDDGPDEDAPLPSVQPVTVLEMMPGQDLAAGAPVTIPYGAKDNTAFLLRFGFNDGPERHRAAVAPWKDVKAWGFTDVRPPDSPVLQAPPAALPLVDSGGPWTAAAQQLLDGEDAGACTVDLHPSLSPCLPLALLGALHSAVGAQRAALQGAAVSGVEVTEAKQGLCICFSTGAGGVSLTWVGPNLQHWCGVAAAGLAALASRHQAAAPRPADLPPHLTEALEVWMQRQQAALQATAKACEATA